MKYLSALLLIVTLGLSACKKEQVNNDLETSYQHWKQFKAANNNSYTFTLYSFSILDYSTRETRITVYNGKITAREYLIVRTSYSPQNIATKDTVTYWKETTGSFNTHPDSYSAWEPQTIDEIYQQARTTWLKADKTKNNISFAVDSTGLIASAGYVVKDCQDDCFVGARIKDIKLYVKEIK
jgi:hypothetical protein